MGLRDDCVVCVESYSVHVSLTTDTSNTNRKLRIPRVRPLLRC